MVLLEYWYQYMNFNGKVCGAFALRGYGPGSVWMYGVCPGHYGRVPDFCFVFDTACRVTSDVAAQTASTIAPGLVPEAAGTVWPSQKGTIADGRWDWFDSDARH